MVDSSLEKDAARHSPVQPFLIGTVIGGIAGAILGTALSPAGEAAMRHWIAANPQHQHGGHRYAAADFGLDPQAIRTRFADYSRRFGL